MSTAEICALAKEASYRLATFTNTEKKAMLIAMANGIGDEMDQILEANADDLFIAKENGKEETFIDRLTLYKSRLRQMIEGIMQVADLPDPVGEVTGVEAPERVLGHHVYGQAADGLAVVLAPEPRQGICGDGQQLGRGNGQTGDDD